MLILCAIELIILTVTPYKICAVQTTLENIDARNMLQVFDKLWDCLKELNSALIRLQEP